MWLVTWSSVSGVCLLRLGQIFSRLTLSPEMLSVFLPKLVGHWLFYWQVDASTHRTKDPLYTSLLGPEVGATMCVLYLLKCRYKRFKGPAYFLFLPWPIGNSGLKWVYCASSAVSFLAVQPWLLSSLPSPSFCGSSWVWVRSEMTVGHLILS